MVPSAPGWLQQVFGGAARQKGHIAAALEQRPLERGMVGMAGTVPTITIPRLSGGAATAVQSAENSAVQETDPVSASSAAALGTIAGQVDESQQLSDFSPGMDELLMGELGGDFGTDLDQQIVNGSGSAGQMRGLLNVASILTATSAATTVQGQISALWAGFRSLAGTSGFGAPAPDEYLVLVNPGRFAWWSGGSGDASNIAGELRLPGRLVASGAVPEAEAYLVVRDQLILVGGRPSFRIFEDVGSSTLTVRVSCWGYAALLVKSPLAVFRLSGLAAVSF